MENIRDWSIYIFPMHMNECCFLRNWWFMREVDGILWNMFMKIHFESIWTIREISCTLLSLLQIWYFCLESEVINLQPWFRRIFIYIVYFAEVWFLCHENNVILSTYIMNQLHTFYSSSEKNNCFSKKNKFFMWDGGMRWLNLKPG